MLSGASSTDRPATKELTGIIEREGDGYVALCPELDIASQGASVEEARRNLREAVELLFETADASAVRRRAARLRWPAASRCS